jgi:tetratricopeptide (TPR) repeat protein
MMALLNNVPLTADLFPIIHAVVSSYVMGGAYNKALSILERADRQLVDKDAVTTNLFHWGYGYLLFLLGQFEESLFHSQKMVDSYDLLQLGNLRKIYGSDPGVSSLIYCSWVLWLLGYPQQAMVRSQQAIDLGIVLDDLDNKVYSQVLSSFLFVAMRALERVEELLKSCKTLLEKQSSSLSIAELKFTQGVYQFYAGEKDSGLENVYLGIESLENMAVLNFLSVHYAIQVEIFLKSGQIERASQCLKRADDFIVATGEGIYPAELQRLKGEYLLLKGRIEEAQACLLQAQEMAREQKAKSIELRVAMSLARLWQSQGRVKDAYRVLADVFSWFTEGFQTHDLQEAQSLLEELRGDL